MKVLKTITIALTLFSLVLAVDEKPRIAIVGLETNGVSELEGAAAELSIRNAFVNSGKYKVLDRENMDKILIERTIASDGLYDKDKALDIGRVLNVHHIMVGTLMKFQGDYLMELRVIDVENSSVAASSTGKCTSSGELLQLSEYLVKKLCVDEKNEHKDPSIDSLSAAKKSQSDISEVYISKEETASDSLKDSLGLTFKDIGLSMAEYDNYSESKLSVREWIEKRRKNPGTAALIGFCTGTSGFFYTGDYGTGMLVTLSKALGVIGMISNRKEGGAKYWVFAGITTVAIAGDAVGSSVAAEKRNKKLDVLLEKLPSLGYQSGSKSLSLSYTKKF